MKRWQKFLHLFLAVMLLAGTLGLSALSVAGEPGNVQPVLAQLAAESPKQRVSVIVQKFGDTDSVEGLVESLGGEVTRDLSIINAFSAEMPAQSVPKLAQAGGVRWVSLDAPVLTTAKGGNGKPTPEPTTPPTDDDGGGNGFGEAYVQVFLDTMNVRPVWDMGLKGEGITVAVVDSGIEKMSDFNERTKGRSPSRLIGQLTFNPNSITVDDYFGHGSHVGGIIGGNGDQANGEVSGVAPMVNLISLKISDEQNAAFESDAVAAMQWILDNKDVYNIRVVNLSIHSTVPQSYHTSPIDAAAEILWFNSIVIVTSAGNDGVDAVDYPPANDPFIITVGATDEQQTGDPSDDFVAEYSAYGVTMNGFAKPEIVAPGQDIVSLLSANSNWDYEHNERLEYGNDYIRLSGTSMSAPMVAGAVALLLQDEPDLNPDQVKYRLMATGSSIQGSDGDPNSYPYLDVYAAVTGTTTESANTNIEASQLLWSGDEPVNWDSVNWNSVNWNSVNWNSVNWNSVNWNSVNWNSVAWDY